MQLEVLGTHKRKDFVNIGYKCIVDGKIRYLSTEGLSKLIMEHGEKVDNCYKLGNMMYFKMYDGAGFFKKVIDTSKQLKKAN